MLLNTRKYEKLSLIKFTNDTNGAYIKVNLWYVWMT